VSRPITWFAKVCVKPYDIRNADGSTRTTIKVKGIPIDRLKLNTMLEAKGFKEGDEVILTIRKKGARDPYDVIMELIGVT
jgi:hypothetical protein